MNSSSKKIILVTGVSRGIGLAIVKRLLLSNEHTRIIGISRSSIQQSNSDLNFLVSNYPSRFLYHQLDLATVCQNKGTNTKSTILSAFEELVRHYKTHFNQSDQELLKFDCIIHNAGKLDPIQKIRDTDLEDWKHLFDVNLFSGIALAKWALNLVPQTTQEQKQQNHSMKFILVSSGAATKGYPAWGAYCTSKAAGNMLVNVLAAEEPSVYALAIRPGVVNTEMQTLIRSEGVKGGMPAEFHQRFTQLHDSNQLLTPEKPGHVIADFVLKEQYPLELNGGFVSWDDPKLL